MTYTVINRRFPTLALVILVVGLISVATIIALPVFLPSLTPTGNAISITQAKQSVDQYLSGSSDLKVVEIEEYSQNFYARIEETTTGISAFALLVNKASGAVAREPGPDMMWNTKYGMMTFGQTSTINMPVSADQAKGYAQRWIDINVKGGKAEDPDVFHGYYTIDISFNNSTYGMLSVNGYSGDVWYHTWHGQFITSVEYS